MRLKNDSPAPFIPFLSERAYTAVLLILALLLVASLLFLGLRQKNWPVENGVQWLPGQQAVRFHSPSMAYVDDLKIFSTDPAVDEFTFHLGITVPDLKVKGFRPILTLYSASDEHQLAVWHWGAAVIAMNGDDYDYSRRWPRISADGALKPGVPTLITITSGPSGTRLFIDGSLVKEHGERILEIPNEGQKLRLILGNSVYGKQGWDGDFHSLAVFDRELDPVEIGKRRQSWEQVESLRLFYPFNEGRGRIIHDKSGSNNPMVIPSRPVVLKRTFLSTPWHDVHSRSFWLDAVVNFLGFIPLGAVVYSLLRQLKGVQNRNAAMATALFGFLLSLTIEVIQVWLPARASSLLDLVLNSAGAVAGIAVMTILFRLRDRRAEKR